MLTASSNSRYVGLNLKNTNFDFIRSILHECGYFELMIRFLGSIKKLHSVLLQRSKIKTLEKSTAFLIRPLKCHEIILQPFFSSVVTIDAENKIKDYM